MKQQPGWKKVYDSMPSNDRVSMAEVNCRESRELMQKHQVTLIPRVGKSLELHCSSARVIRMSALRFLLISVLDAKWFSA